MLQISPDLELPLSFATEGVVAVGMRGSGKSNTLVRWAEVLYDADIPFVAVDPKGDWGGIRSSADGKKPGLSVPVFGGLSEDFPLDEHLGARIADLLVDQNLSAVLDASRLSIAARGRFLTAFCNRLMDRHQQEPHVRCVILEEAHRYIPQETNKDTRIVKEAAAALLLEGRAFGLGCWAATQRPARLHKDVLEEVGTAILHRIGAAATNDLRTISGWVKHEELSDEIVPSLTKLAAGEAWVLAPSTLGIAKRVRIDRRTTYDSASTPLVGAGSRPTLTMADIDAAAIKEALAETIEKAKADDPKELRKEIAALKRQLTERHAAEPVVERVEVEVPVFYVPKAVADQVTALVTRAGDLSSAVSGLAVAIADAATDRPGGGGAPAQRPAPRRAPAATSTARPSTPTRPSPLADGDTTLNKAERAIVAALVQKPDADREQLAILAGYHARSKGYTNALGSLRSAGLLDDIRLTDAGMATAESLGLEPIADMWTHWYHHPKVDGAGRRILDALAEAWPDGMDRVALAEATGYHERSKGFTNALGRLRTLQLVARGTGDIRLTDDFGETIT